MVTIMLIIKFIAFIIILLDCIGYFIEQMENYKASDGTVIGVILGVIIRAFALYFFWN